MEGGSLMSLVLRHLLEGVVSRKAPGVLEVSWLGVTLHPAPHGAGKKVAPGWHRVSSPAPLALV